MDISLDEATSLSNHSAYLDLISLLDGRYGWCTYMLSYGYDDLLGQGYRLNRTSC